jgi:NADPH-dependent 7-cyano-7-deazaguanine reductase QueF-like protein
MKQNKEFIYYLNDFKDFIEMVVSVGKEMNRKDLSSIENAKIDGRLEAFEFMAGRIDEIIKEYIEMHTED